MTLIDTNLDTFDKIASLNSESACKPIKRIAGLCLLKSSLPGSASGMHVKSLSKSRVRFSIDKKKNHLKFLSNCSLIRDPAFILRCNS